MARKPAMPTTTVLDWNFPFCHRRSMASDTAEWSWTSPSTMAPGGRPTCPNATNTGAPAPNSSSAARTALVPMSSPTICAMTPLSWSPWCSYEGTRMRMNGLGSCRLEIYRHLGGDS